MSVTQGEPLLNPATRKAEAVLAEFRASKADVWSSKDVLQIIRRKTASGAAALSSAPSTPADTIVPAIGAQLMTRCPSLPHLCVLLAAPCWAAHRTHQACMLPVSVEAQHADANIDNFAASNCCW